jgi:hypothetical protein
MKWVWRIAVALLALVIAIPTMAFTELWFSAGATIARAERSGLVNANNAPLSVAERTIALVEYRSSWSTREAPCRSFAGVWRGITGDHTQRIVSGRSVATAAAQRLLDERARARHLRRHLEAIFVACRLEQRYSDDALLRAWLSRAYFGVQPLGVEPAAQALFQKSASALNETESLYLAVLLRSPRLQRDPERWAQRVRIVAAQLPRETIGAR